MEDGSRQKLRLKLLEVFGLHKDDWRDLIAFYCFTYSKLLCSHHSLLLQMFHSCKSGDKSFKQSAQKISIIPTRLHMERLIEKKKQLANIVLRALWQSRISMPRGCVHHLSLVLSHSFFSCCLFLHFLPPLKLLQAVRWKPCCWELW